MDFELAVRGRNFKALSCALTYLSRLYLVKGLPRSTVSRLG